MFGFINLNKPEGWTSHDCVARLRRLLRTKQIGHGGTLDPLATGVLPIAVGAATRLLQFLPTAKAYRATVRFGLTTTTDDLAGDILDTRSAASLELEQVIQALPALQGQIQQVPPCYSAIQVNGKRLYALARQGEVVQPEPRTVTVDRIDVLDWQRADPEHPEITLDIACGPGTYIRSIARDLGATLQVGGTLAQLVRTESCGFSLSDSLTLADIEQQLNLQTLNLIDPAIALRHQPSLCLDESTATRWCQGQPVALSSPVPDAWVCVYDTASRFLGMGWVQDTLLCPKVVLATPHAAESP